MDDDIHFRQAKLIAEDIRDRYPIDRRIPILRAWVCRIGGLPPDQWEVLIGIVSN